MLLWGVPQAPTSTYPAYRAPSALVFIGNEAAAVRLAGADRVCRARNGPCSHQTGESRGCSVILAASRPRNRDRGRLVCTLSRRRWTPPRNSRAMEWGRCKATLGLTAGSRVTAFGEPAGRGAGAWRYPVSVGTTGQPTDRSNTAPASSSRSASLDLPHTRRRPRHGRRGGAARSAERCRRVRSAREETPALAPECAPARRPSSSPCRAPRFASVYRRRLWGTSFLCVRRSRHAGHISRADIPPPVGAGRHPLMPEMSALPRLLSRRGVRSLAGVSRRAGEASRSDPCAM